MYCGSCGGNYPDTGGGILAVVGAFHGGGGGADLALRNGGRAERGDRRGRSAEDPHDCVTCRRQSRALQLEGLEFLERLQKSPIDNLLLIQVLGHEQLDAAAAHVTHFQHHPERKFPLDVNAVLDHIRRAQIRIEDADAGRARVRKRQIGAAGWGVVGMPSPARTSVPFALG